MSRDDGFKRHFVEERRVGRPRCCRAQCWRRTAERSRSMTPSSTRRATEGCTFYRVHAAGARVFLPLKPVTHTCRRRSAYHPFARCPPNPTLPTNDHFPVGRQSPSMQRRRRWRPLSNTCQREHLSTFTLPGGDLSEAKGLSLGTVAEQRYFYLRY